MKEYGTIDQDPTAYLHLYEYLVVNSIAPTYILHHPRRPLASKQCMWPGSLVVQAVLPDLTVITSTQLRPGGTARITRN